MPPTVRSLNPGVPVWAWRAVMAIVEPIEHRRFARGRSHAVISDVDIDYVGAGHPDQRLDVIRPTGTGDAPLPVYVYFHGGGWTSGRKRSLVSYCAAQAETGMVVVNVEYRKAPRAAMTEMLQDAAAALSWVGRRIHRYGGDPQRIVLGGDSAGGQLAGLLAQLGGRAELAEHWGVAPTVPTASIRGVVQHCSALDLSVVFERGFVMGRGFVRMLLPGAADAIALRSRWLSPIEWLWPGHPPVLVTTSRRDFFYGASRNFVDVARAVGVRVVEHIDPRAQHTWQQNTRHPASAAVYTALREFVASVTAPRADALAAVSAD